MTAGTGKGRVWFFAGLWAFPGLLTLTEAYRLSGLPKYREVGFFEGPIGYMTVIGSLLIGFSLWDLVSGLFRRSQTLARGPDKASSGTGKIWAVLFFMVLFLVLVPLLGFILASGVFLAATLLLLGCTIKVTAAADLVYCLGLYWMVPVLGLSLPRGMLGL